MDVNEKIKSLVGALEELGDALSKNLADTVQGDGLPEPGNAFDKTEEQKDKENRDKLAKAVGEEINKKQLDFYEKMFGEPGQTSGSRSNPWTTASTSAAATATAQVKPKLGSAGDDKDTDNLREIKEKVTRVEIATINKTARNNLADSIVDGLEESSLFDKLGKIAGNFGKDMDFKSMIPLLLALGATGLYDWLMKKGADGVSTWLDEGGGSGGMALLKTLLPTGTFKSLLNSTKWLAGKGIDMTKDGISALKTATTTMAMKAESMATQQAARQALTEAAEAAGKNADEVARIAKELSEESVKLVSSVSSYGDDAVKLVSTTITTAGTSAGKLVADAIKNSGTEAGKVVATAITNNGAQAGKVVSKVLSDSGLAAAESMAKSISSGGDEAAKAIASVMGDESAKIVTTISQQTRALQTAATQAAGQIDEAAKAASTTISITNKKLADAVETLKKQNIPTAKPPPPTASIDPPKLPPGDGGSLPPEQQRRMQQAMDNIKASQGNADEVIEQAAKNVDKIDEGVKAAAETAKTTQTGAKALANSTDDLTKAATAATNATKLSTKAFIGLSTIISYGSAAVRFDDENMLTGEKKDRDYIGGSLDVVSGTVGLVPVFGQAISLGIDVGHMALDMSTKGRRIKGYVNRLGQDSVEMEAFGKAVEERVKQQSKELAAATVGIKDMNAVAKAASIGASTAGGWEYHDRTEDFRDELLGAIRKHGKNIDKIYNELDADAKQNMKLLEKKLGTDYKGVIGGLLQNYETIEYQDTNWSGGLWQYTEPVTKTRANVEEGEKLFEAANNLGLMMSGLTVSEKKKEWATNNMVKQFLDAGAVTIGNQTLKLDNVWDDGWTRDGNFEMNQVLTPETMAELERLKTSKKETDQWIWQSLKWLEIEKMMTGNDSAKQALVNKMIMEEMDRMDKEQAVIDQLREGATKTTLINNETGMPIKDVLPTYRFGIGQKTELDQLLQAFPDKRGSTDLPDTYDHLIENIKSHEDPYFRSSQMQNLERMMQIAGLDAGFEDDEKSRALVIQALNEEIFLRAQETGKQLSTPKWDMLKAEEDRARPSFPHADSMFMIRAREQKETFEEMKKLREDLKINFDKQSEINIKVGQILDNQNTDNDSNTYVDASSRSSTTVVSTPSPGMNQQRDMVHHRLFVNQNQ